MVIRFTNRQSPAKRAGFTLIELTITIILVTVLIGVVSYIFRTVLISWYSQQTRAGIQTNLDRAVEEMARDLREAKAVQSTANYNEIRFTVDEGGSDAYYIYYLYNGSDSYVPPPAFDQDYYELRKATLSGDISGTFTYGSGRIIIQADANGGVLPPTTSDLSFDGIITTIDLSVTRWDETIRSRTEVKPSNLQVPSISSGSYLATTIYGGTMCTLYWSTDVPSDGTFHIWNAGSPELYKASAVATDSNGGILHTVNWVAPSGWPTGSYYYYVQSDGVPGEGRRTTISSAPPP